MDSSAQSGPHYYRSTTPGEMRFREAAQSIVGCRGMIWHHTERRSNRIAKIGVSEAYLSNHGG